MFNSLFAVIIFVILSPLYFVIVVIIFLEDGLPVHFKQKRIGIDNSSFMLYKFRSMRKETPNVATHLLKDPEKYLLRSGAVLRKLSLDELPNLINIIKGEMVFVGPRPALYNQEDLIELRIIAGVHKLKPGLTGWAQINGRDEIPIEIKVALEKEYLERKSIWFDIYILFKTATAVIAGKGVSH